MIDVNALRKGVTFTMDAGCTRSSTTSTTSLAGARPSSAPNCATCAAAATIDKNFTSGDRVQDIRLDHQTVQYLYSDGEFLLLYGY